MMANITAENCPVLRRELPIFLAELFSPLPQALTGDPNYYTAVNAAALKTSITPWLNTIVAKIGEKITLGRAKTIQYNNSKNYSYLHTVVKDNLSKLAVIVSLNSSGKSDKLDLFGKQLSMHIAASNPLSVDINGINKQILEKEQELITEELKSSGKTEDIAKKISFGKMNKFKEENSLLTQQWVMEPKKKVTDIINEMDIKDLKIVDFYRIKIGD